MTILKRTLRADRVANSHTSKHGNKTKRMSIRPEVLYGSDFETNPPKDGVVNVWLWSIVRASDGSYIVGESIEEWYQEVMKLSGIVCFHNLKFDGQFILDYLIRNDIQFDREHTTIDAVSHIPYRIALKEDLYIQDTMRVHTVSLEKMAKSYGIAGKSEKADFTIYHEFGKATEKEIQYVLQDSNIVAQVLKADCIANNGYIPVTGASYAKKKYVEWLKQSGMVDIGNRRATADDYLSQIFPCIDSDWMKLSRMSYMGGLSIVNRSVYSRVNGLTYVYDVNSAYPYQMASKPIPVGEGTWTDSYNKDTFGIYYVWCEFDHMDNSCPIIHKSRAFNRHLPDGCHWMDNMLNIYGESDYIESYSGYLVLTSIEIEYLRKYADLMFSVEYGYTFETRTDVFRDYIRNVYSQRRAVKESDPVLAGFLKLCMNSLYGKFGSDVKYGCILEIDEENHYHEKVDMKDVDTPWCYVPVATAITGYQRVYIATMISENWDGFLYTDTDSIHLDKPHVEGTMWIDQTELGALKCESISEHSKYIRPKCYVHENEYEIKADGSKGKCSPISVKCGGMPDNLKAMIHAMDDLYMGAEFDGKLMPVRYVGGVYLKPTTYKLNDLYRM